MAKSDEKAWKIAELIHAQKQSIIDLTLSLDSMGYVLHFNKNDFDEYEPVLYKKGKNSIRKVLK